MSTLPGTCHFISDVMFIVLRSLSREVIGFILGEGCGYGNLPVYQDFARWSILMIMGTLCSLLGGEWSWEFCSLWSSLVIMSFLLNWWTQYCQCGLTGVQQWGRFTSLDLLAAFLLMQARKSSFVRGHIAGFCSAWCPAGALSYFLLTVSENVASKRYKFWNSSSRSCITIWRLACRK